MSLGLPVLANALEKPLHAEIPTNLMIRALDAKVVMLEPIFIVVDSPSNAFRGHNIYCFEGEDCSCQQGCFSQVLKC